MWSGDKLVKPKKISLLLSIVFAIIVYFLSRISPMISYILALAVLIIEGFMDMPWWPTQAREENVVAFSITWGLILGLVLPFLISIFMDKGFEGIIEMLTT